MAGWTRHSGVAVALPMENIDTDQLIPARFMSTPRAAGYGQFLLHDMRRDAQGAALNDFPLNRHPGASVLVTRRNFGCGSSREAAVYALIDAGFRAVIAPGFGDIFAANAVNNGLLPAPVSEAVAAALIAALGDGVAESQIDLETGQGAIGGQSFDFVLDPVWRQKLIMGWDDIDLTQSHRARIAAFRAARQTSASWSIPGAGSDCPPIPPARI